MYHIYKYTNKVNGKVYIGQTKNTLAERAQTNGRNYRGCRRFYAAIEKYSWDAFVPEVIETVETLGEANEREQYYIDLYNSMDERFGYNLLHGGDNKEMLPETKELISVKAKERYTDKTANPMYGRKHSAETIEKQSKKKRGRLNPMFGSKWTELQKQNSGTRGKKLDLSDEQRVTLAARCKRLGETVNPKAVRCIEDDVSYNSLTEAAQHYNVSVSTLCGHLHGKQYSCAGKHFEYIDLEGATTIETTVV